MLNKQTKVLLAHERTPLDVCRLGVVSSTVQVDLQWASRMKQEPAANKRRADTWKDKKLAEEFDELMW